MDVASLVIPAYNERNRIEACLRSVAEWVRARPGGWDWEVILVDDGSSDGTHAAAQRLAGELGLPLQVLRHEKNRGKGCALRAGVLASSGDPVLVSDVDLSTPLTEWLKLAERLPTHPIAIGSRALEEDLVRRRQPFYRRLLGKTGNLLVRLLAVPGIRDTQCGFKLFRGDVARDLFRRAQDQRVRLRHGDPVPGASARPRHRGGACPLVQLARLPGLAPARRPSDALGPPAAPLATSEVIDDGLRSSQAQGDAGGSQRGEGRDDAG